MRRERCDVKVWSGECEHATYRTMSEKYLCDSCGTIKEMNHQVGHEWFIHMEGNDSTLY